MTQRKPLSEKALRAAIEEVAEKGVAALRIYTEEARQKARAMKAQEK